MNDLTIDQMITNNYNAGQHFFSPNACSFFGSNVESEILGDCYFITSEQPPTGPKRFTVREAMERGRSIRTVGDFCEHRTLKQARQAVKDLILTR